MRYLREYVDRKIDLIVAADPILEDMAAELRDTLFPNAKIIGARSLFVNANKNLNADISYIAMKMGVTETFGQMFRFQPNLRNIYWS